MTNCMGKAQCEPSSSSQPLSHLPYSLLHEHGGARVDGPWVNGHSKRWAPSARFFSPPTPATQASPTFPYCIQQCPSLSLSAPILLVTAARQCCSAAGLSTGTIRMTTHLCAVLQRVRLTLALPLPFLLIHRAGPRSHSTRTLTPTYLAHSALLVLGLKLPPFPVTLQVSRWHP